MKKIISLIAAMGVASPMWAATLSGKINYAGAAKATPIRMNADPGCAKANPKPVMSEDIVANPNKTLANVFVYVKEGVKNPPADVGPAVEIDQQGCMYHPHVMGIRVGQTLKIMNGDSLLHNVNAQAKVNQRFNVGMATKGQSVEKKFTKPETMIKFKCDVHGWMSGYVGVLDHPYFAVSDKEGNFTIKDLPAGEYTVEAWHEKLGTKTAKLTVAGDKATTDFSF